MSNSPPAIKIANVTKHYRIYPTPWDRLRDAFGWSSKYKDFNAISNVSLDIKQGEFWGIVGKNGSGKSTLLKAVAGQLQATSGSINIHGRVTLLQLGLGFDPELTGLENIKHSRLLQNLTSDFEEVVEFVKDFSELGDFINYPVKTYSSGMHSRLGFATAIAGDPDILIADEVLAVGDMNFAQKCLAKMREFKERGKTVVLVTHDVNSVKSFCDHAVWLNEGKVISSGPAKLVADDFRNYMLYGVISDLSSHGSNSGSELADVKDEMSIDISQTAKKTIEWLKPNDNRQTVSSGKVDIKGYRFFSQKSQETLTALIPGGEIGLQISFCVKQTCELHSFGFTLHDRNGMIALHLNSEFFGGLIFEPVIEQTHLATFEFDAPMLADGEYSISLGCSEGCDGVMIEKYDYDSTIEIRNKESLITDRQGGYVVVPAGSFGYQVNA